MNKVVALNSGGFDSVVMLHHLNETLEDTKIVSLFFNYGQRNLYLERECARKVSESLRLEHHEVTIPNFNWSTNSYLCNDKQGATEYLEMRNVIFFAYALSLCESIGATDIYSAILKDGTFPDTNAHFIKNTEKYFETFKIGFKTPFATVDKYFLGHLARKYFVGSTDFFSCNTPVDGKFCGKCGDCLILKDVFNDTILNNTPIKEWLDNKVSDNFKYLFMDSDIKEVRLLINNKCQFSCKHCFYGFNKTKQPDLTKEEMLRVIDESAKLKGVQNFHFSGKEPLFDESIFEYVDYIKKNYSQTCDVVTNGVNVAKYIKQLKKMDKVYLSVDSLVNKGIRPENKFIVDNIKLLTKNNIPVEIFIDLHKGNFTEVKKTIELLYEFGIKNFFVRTVCPLGKGKDLNSILTIDDVEQVYKSLASIQENGLNITFHMQSGFTKQLLENPEKYEDYKVLNDLLFMLETTYTYATPNLNFLPELYCGSGENQITITSDGYVLGCATEVSTPSYDKVAGGNVRDNDLDSLVKARKKMTLDLLDMKADKGDYVFSCYHSFYKIN